MWRAVIADRADMAERADITDDADRAEWTDRANIGDGKYYLVLGTNIGILLLLLLGIFNRYNNLLLSAWFPNKPLYNQ